MDPTFPTNYFPGLDPLAARLKLTAALLPSSASANRSEPPSAIRRTLTPIPIETFIEIYGSRVALTVIVEARGSDWMDRTQEEARLLMRARRHLKQTDDDTFAILGSDALLDLFRILTGSIASAMVGIVSIFVVIGGVVIMNVMLASVTERTREIGMRKSVGATRGDILMQFLVESSVLSGVGGIFGLALAWLLSELVRRLLPCPCPSHSARSCWRWSSHTGGTVLRNLSRAESFEAESHRSHAPGKLKGS